MRARAPIAALLAVLALASCMPAAAFFDLGSLLGGPLHASCKLTWTFPGQQCADVAAALVDAATKMSGDDCNGSERCLYSVQSSSASKISAKHETPVKHYKDDLTLSLSQQTANDCVVAGYSTSETWYAVLDYGTNYCNLRNLADATGLKFSESVSASTCTQVGSANCDKY